MLYSRLVTHANKQGQRTVRIYEASRIEISDSVRVREANTEDLSAESQQSEKSFRKGKNGKQSIVLWLMGCRFSGWSVCLNMHSPYVLLPPYC